MEFQGLPHLSIGAFSKETPEKLVTGSYAELRLGEPNIAEVKIRERTLSRYKF